MQKAVYEFISKETNDPILERRTCRWTGKEFAIFQSDLDFLKKISPVFGEKRFQIPLPTLCPEERHRRRLSFRNERTLYRRKCDLCNKNIISIFSLEKEQKVYCYHCWWSDQWDAIEYKQELDPNASFTNQYFRLAQQVPELSTTIADAENSDYTNGGVGNKNCYLLFVASHNESCLYSRWILNSQNIVDCDNMHHCDTCYSCDGCVNCSQCFSCKECSDCSSCTTCTNCRGCSYCTNCHNLTNKSYCINNQQYSKEEYFQRISYLAPQNTKKQILAAVTQNNCEGCIGDKISNSKHSIVSFSAEKTEDTKYCRDTHDLSDAMDISFQSDSTSRIYECCGLERAEKSMGILLCLNISNSYYCHLCFDSSHLFGCIGLRNKQYCIFNKQYSKEEYEKLVPQLIQKMQADGERGEFFDPSLSSFCYNETAAQEYFPLTREEALSKGYKWMDKEYPINIPDGIQTIDAHELSDLPATEYSDDILSKAIICKASGKPFRIVKQELEFYRKHKLPIPRLHPNIRHQQRLQQRPDRTLYLRTCDKTGKEVLSVYPQDVAFPVYSQEAYEAEVY